MIEILVELGLSKNDAAVYAALVDVGPCFVAPLVKETKKHRQIVYNSLETLLAHNLISVSQKNGKNFYVISNPHHLLADIKKREALAQNLITSIEQKQKNTFCKECGRAM